MLGRILVLLAAVIAAGPAAAAEAVKNIDFMIGADVGGGHDIYARTIARYLPRYLHGTPTVIPRNMPGAGGARVAFYMYSVAPKDGTVIAAVFPGVVIDPLLDERAMPGFRPEKFQYLGSANSGTRVCMTFHHSKVKTYADALTTKTIVGASAGGGATRDYAAFHKKTTGADFEIVTGYKGSAEIFFAMERGEVDGTCGLDWSSVKSQRPDWVRDKKINILVQDNLDPEPELSAMGVPQIWPYIKDEDDKKAVELVVSQQIFSRPYLTPPGIAPQQLAALRAAFAATLEDKELLDDAQKRRIEIMPSSGEKIQSVVEKLYATPKRIVERSREIIKP